MSAIVVLALSSLASAQTLKIEVSVSATTCAIEVRAEFPEAIKVVSFPNAYANVFGLADRIENVNADSRTGPAFRKLATGEFESANPVKSIWYKVDLANAVAPNQESHVSSLNRDRGVLMLADMLPRSLKEGGSFAAVNVKLNLPANWQSMSNATRVDRDIFFSRDPINAVFVVSSKLKANRTKAGTLLFSVGVAGDWSISDKDILKIGRRILEQYAKLTKFQLSENPTLIVVPYAGSAGAERWTAETRGNCVVLFLGNRGNKDKTKSRISVVLAHELFHLWVPNSLNLTGDYDWFFEGFTVYQALRTDLHLKLISFSDYLDTIASVYDAYRNSPGNDALSLSAASEQRWTASSSALIYNKATLVAFLYDLALRRATACEGSFDDLYRGLLASSSRHEDGNKFIIALLNSTRDLQSFVKDYVEGTIPIELETLVSEYGLRATEVNGATRLVVADKPTNSQAKILKCLVKN